MAINSRYDAVVLDLIESASRNIKALPVNLGGVSGAYGGVGGPPGGFIGRLPQTRVAYDESELGTDYTPASGMSLLDNLNHIRNRLDIIESGGSGSPLTVEEYGGTPSVPNVATIVFSGAVNVIDDGGNQVTVQITASGGGGISDAPSDGNVYGRQDASWTNTDTRYLLLDASNSPLTGRLLIYDLPDGTDASYLASNGDASPVYMEQYTNTDNVSVPTLGMYRTTSGVGNIISPMIEGYQDSSGAGAITGDFIYLEDSDSGAFFGVDKDGNVNIPSGMFYNINGTPHTHSGYMLASNNLSDLTNAGTARTNLGLVAGGAGDIWVEKAGDTMTGLLTITPSTPGNSITATGEVTINTGANAEPGLTIVGNGFFQTAKLFTINDNYWGDRLTVDKLGQVYIQLNPGTTDSNGLQVQSYPAGATFSRALHFQVIGQNASHTYLQGFSGVVSIDAYTADAYANQMYAGNVQLYIATSGGASRTVTWTDGVGINIQAPSITGAGTIAGTNLFGMRIFNQGNSHNTNSYGIWIDDQSGSATSNYSIYTKAGDIRLMASGSDKMGLWGATPVAQPTTAIGEASFTENAGGTAVNVDSTFDGYTLQQVVKALRDLGALA